MGTMNGRPTSCVKELSTSAKSPAKKYESKRDSLWLSFATPSVLVKSYVPDAQVLRKPGRTTAQGSALRVPDGVGEGRCALPKPALLR